MESQTSTENAVDLLFLMRCKGIEVWKESGKLRYRTTKGRLSPEDAARLHAKKVDILAVLNDSTVSATNEPPLVPRFSTHPAPLTFQQEGWLSTLAGRPSRRLGLATRLLGRLNVEYLRKSFTELVRRHESLRTRIVVTDGKPTQVIDEAREFNLGVLDLTGTGEDREVVARNIIKRLVAEPIDVSVGPLFASSVVKIGANDHVVGMAIDHLISDGASLATLQREIWTTYSKLACALPLSLPPMPVQLADVAIWQRGRQQSWVDRYEAYWKARLAGAHSVRFPRDEEVKNQTPVTWGLLPTRFGTALSASLRELCRRQHTTLAVAVLAAYVALISRWCNASDIVVATSAASRYRPELENVIGFLAAGLVLRIEIGKNDRLADLIERVAGEYNAAYEHAPGGIMSSEVFKLVGIDIGFNWVPREYTWDFAPDLSAYGLGDILNAQPFKLDVNSFAFDEIQLDWCPSPTLWDNTDEVSGHILYRTNCSSVRTMERLERNLRFFAERLITEPNARVEAMSCI